MIGVFDSGFGGLTTLRELLRLMPERGYIFLGDQARAPYGNHSVERVTEYAEEGVEFLFSRGAKVVLIACNTASTDALRNLQNKYGAKKKVLGVLVPALESAIKNSRYGRIGLIATRSTIESGNFVTQLEKIWKDHWHPEEKKALKKPTLLSIAAPLLVPLVEEGWIDRPETKMILRKYLLPLKNANIDTLILGCTHYPLLEKHFAKKMGRSCEIINSGKAQAESFIDYLKRHPEIEKTLLNTNSVQYFTTESPERFKKLGEKFLNRKIPHVEKISLS